MKRDSKLAKIRAGALFMPAFVNTGQLVLLDLEDFGYTLSALF